MPAGFQSKAGFKREATVFGQRVWPSTAPAVITDLLPLVSEGVNVQLDQQALVTRETASVPGFSKIIRRSVSGPVVINADYEGMEFLITAAMGQQANRIGGVLQPEDIDSAIAYRHILEVDRDVNQAGWFAGDGFLAGPQPTGDGLIAGTKKTRRGTFAIQKGPAVWETKSAMVDSFTIQVSPSGITLQTQLLAHDITYGSGVNNGISAFICSINRILFKNATLFIKAIDGGPLTDTDIVGDINGFALNFSNGLSSINTRDTGIFIEEPQRGGAVTVSGSFSLPRFENDDLINLNSGNTPSLMKLECIGDNIPGTSENFQMNLWLPRVNFSGGSLETTGPGQVRQNFSFLGMAGNSPPGFPLNTREGPLIVEFVNTKSDHALLD